jgi:hypothetical protein
VKPARWRLPESPWIFHGFDDGGMPLFPGAQTHEMSRAIRDWTGLESVWERWHPATALHRLILGPRLVREEVQ